MSKKNPEPQNNNNVFDLTEILSKPVANQNVDPIFRLDEENAIEDAQFDDAPIEVIQDDEPVDNEDNGFMSSKDIAESIVNLLDGLQSSVIPFMLEKKTFTAKELELLQSLDTSGKTVYSQNSPESAVLAKYLKHKKTIEKIPFSNGETRRLVNATARYAETTKMKVTPLQGLMISYSEVIVKRTSVFFSE
jgi:hypothetical protein